MSGAARARARQRATRAASEAVDEEAGPSNSNTIPVDDGPVVLEVPDASGGESQAPSVGSPIRSPTPQSIDGVLLGPSTSERHAELRKLVAQKRQLEEIKQMEAELRGETPDAPVDVPGTSMPIRKRSATSSQGNNPAKYVKLGQPKQYSGKDLGELQDYDTSWKLQFAAMPGMQDLNDADRINIAATSLTDIAASTWARNEEPVETWAEFIALLRNIVQDPANRMMEALIKIRKKQQREGQTVRELYEELAQLRRDIPVLGEEQTRAWELLLALRPQIRIEVLRQLPRIENEEQVLRAAQRQAELDRQTAQYSKAPKKEGSGTPGKPSTPKVFGKRPATSKPAGQAGKSETRERPTPGSVVCYNCDKKGHISRDCPEEKKGSHAGRVATGKGKGKEVKN